MADVKPDNENPSVTFPAFIRRAPTLWAGLAMVAVIFIMGMVKGQLGGIGQDNDDVMRLVQIRDYLNGQSWFETDQYRLGLAGGTDMHWSRIPDIPLIILTHIFDIFMPQETALRIAYTVWPPFSALILIFAMATGAKFWAPREGGGDNKVYLFTLVLLAFFVFSFYRFSPGAIDHHNVQMGLVAWAMVMLFDPRLRFWAGAVSGMSIALSLAVGVEVYIFAAIICVFAALNWMMHGARAKAITQGFGLGLAGGLAAAFFGTIAPNAYGVVACDALSLITLSAGIAGGLGLALAASAVSNRSYLSRLIGLGLIGALCLILLSFQAPQCLANPLSALPDDVTRLWLNNIGEAQALNFKAKNGLTEIPYMIGAPLLALAILGLGLWRDKSHGRPFNTAKILALMLLLGALGLTFYQQRFFPFAYVVSIIPLAAWIADLYKVGKDKIAAHKGDGTKPSNIAYIGALAISIPIIWAAPGLLLADTPAEKPGKGKAAACFSSDVMAALNSLPVGVIAATSNGGAPILQFTNHRSISGNYHRNIAGITLQIKIATSEPEDAKTLLVDNGIDYLHYCRPTAETQNLIDENPSGLYGVIKDGNVPEYLVPAVADLENGAVSIYRVDK